MSVLAEACGGVLVIPCCSVAFVLVPICDGFLHNYSSNNPNRPQTKRKPAANHFSYTLFLNVCITQTVRARRQRSQPWMELQPRMETGLSGGRGATSPPETVACQRGLGPSPSPLQSAWSQIGRPRRLLCSASCMLMTNVVILAGLV